MRACFTTDAAVLKRCSVIIVAVPTPVTSDRLPDLEALRAAARTIGRNMQRGTVVVVESTVYPGVTEEVVGAIIADESGLPAGVGFTLDTPRSGSTPVTTCTRWSDRRQTDPPCPPVRGDAGILPADLRQGVRPPAPSSVVRRLEGTLGHFGGVTDEVLVDNLKPLMVRHDAATREVEFNERFLAFAAHWNSDRGRAHHIGRGPRERRVRGALRQGNAIAGDHIVDVDGALRSGHTTGHEQIGPTNGRWFGTRSADEPLRAEGFDKHPRDRGGTGGYQGTGQVQRRRVVESCGCACREPVSAARWSRPGSGSAGDGSLLPAHRCGHRGAATGTRPPPPGCAAGCPLPGRSSARRPLRLRDGSHLAMTPIELHQTDDALDWNDVAGFFDEYGCVMMNHPELRWYQESWGALMRQGLADWTRFEDYGHAMALLRLRAILSVGDVPGNLSAGDRVRAGAWRVLLRPSLPRDLGISRCLADRPRDPLENGSYRRVPAG